MTSASARQAELVARMKARGIPLTSEIEQAFLAVPRGPFVPDVDPVKAYADEVVPLKEDAGLLVSTSSQPSMMALMLFQLGLERGHRVLEIGAGSGYNAALLKVLVGDEGAVTTIDLYEDLVEAARERLGAAGVTGVVVAAADGTFGYAPRAPYDRMIVTAGPYDLPSAWGEQLVDGGRLVTPLTFRGLTLSLALEKRPDCLSTLSVIPAEFVEMRGAIASGGGRAQSGGFVVQGEEPSRIDQAAILAAARDEDLERTLPGSYTVLDVVMFQLWIAVVDPLACSVSAKVKGGPPKAFLFAIGDRWLSFGLCDGTSLAVVAARRGAPVASASPLEPATVVLRAFGPAAAPLTERLLSRVADWESAGRPRDVSMRAYARGAAPPPAADEHVVAKPSADLLFRLR